MLTAARLAELKSTHAGLPDSYLEKWAKEYARKIATCRNCYAYSHSAAKEYGLSGICFNTTWAGDKIDTSLANDVKSKWHPPGCGTLKAVFDHELGHEIDRLLGLRSHADFLKMYREETAKGKQHIVDSLSTYGHKNEAEFIAEAWSEYLNNETPRPIAVAVGNLVKRLYDEKNQASGSTSPSP